VDWDPRAGRASGTGLWEQPVAGIGKKGFEGDALRLGSLFVVSGRHLMAYCVDRSLSSIAKRMAGPVIPLS
jgi:hypothetical protein